jgi:endonuclease YncB( thermonuclease family)
MRKILSPLTGLATLFALCFSYVVKADAQSATYYRVNRIIDGDTYEVTDSWGNLTQIRLACADTPETYHSYKNKPGYANQSYWGGLATNRVTQLLNQSNNGIWFVPNGGNSYDRRVGDVYLMNGTLLQAAITGEGLAMLDRQYGNCNSWEEQAQAYAQWYRIGVWSDPYFIAPWIFRKQ